MAHRCFKEIQLLSQRLHVLYKFEDELFKEKDDFRNRIARLEESLKLNEAAYMAGYLATELATATNKLRVLLSKQPVPPAPANPGTVLHDALRRLQQRELAGFTLVLNAQTRLQCTVRLARKTLLITLPEVHRHRTEYSLCKHRLNRLRGLGFRYYDQKDKMLLLVSFFTPRDVISVETIFARMVFEVFSNGESIGNSFVKY